MRRGPLNRLPQATPRPARRRATTLTAALALLAALPGCSTVSNVGDTLLGTGGPAIGQPGYVSGFLGGVVADEPRAALAGREVVSGLLMLLFGFSEIMRHAGSDTGHRPRPRARISDRDGREHDLD